MFARRFLAGNVDAISHSVDLLLGQEILWLMEGWAVSRGNVVALAEGRVNRHVNVSTIAEESG